ncbi:hypothetical protein HMPREF0208_00122 [Citrobacter koseri]|uniref:Uncharacterized protein n=1 Tax=Citrobacter koseri (strain ATCC BAA-895 / CDC 4225-83 / SGSC4696) TaxID=290338 RepID=A8AJ85_CITK8|nr:hypothetical protein CKO_02430 [Citrobacter koseri ATCC BAA-895]KXB47346.1 hypothetical protein HMPREF0208_00122 [Citrobacter koseri]
MPDIHVSSCVLSILQVIVIFKPVGLIRRGCVAIRHLTSALSGLQGR